MKKQRRRRRFRKWLILPLLVLLYVLAANGIHPLNDIPLPSFGSEVRTTANEDHGWNLILVNRDHVIPDHYETELTELSNGQKVDSRIYPDLQDMFDEARSQGYGLFVASGYRTAEKQQQLLDEKTEAYEKEGHSRSEARRLAEQWVAVPGTSEHQLGLAVDINADTAYSTSEEVYAWKNILKCWKKQSEHASHEKSRKKRATVMVLPFFSGILLLFQHDQLQDSVGSHCRFKDSVTFIAL